MKINIWLKSHMLEMAFTILFQSPQEHAFEASQKYKEGKFIIELAHMVKENCWDS